jgi:hypothetical protein
VRRVAEVLARQRWVLIVLPFLIGAMLFLPPSDGRSIVGRVIWGVALLVAATVLALNLAGFDPGAAEVTADVDTTSLGRALLVRWLSRSRYGRFVGGAAGLVLGVGFGDGDLGPALLGLLAGVAVGGALVEVHAVSGRHASRRTADLTARRVVDYVPAIDRAALAVVAVLAVAVVIAVTTVERAGSALATRFAISALLVSLATAAMQRAVVGRRRPALEPALRSADDLLRSLAAAQGFTRPAIALAAALVAHALFALGSRWSITALVLWIAALGWYVASWRTRSGILGRQAAIA